MKLYVFMGLALLSYGYAQLNGDIIVDDPAFWNGSSHIYENVSHSNNISVNNSSTSNSVKASKSITLSPNFDITSSSGGSYELSISDYNNSLFEFKSMEENDFLKNNKIEFGLKFNNVVNNKIMCFLENNTSCFDFLNPFNPEDIDVFAEIYFDNPANESNKVFGFYYDNFERKTELSDPNDWYWERIHEEFNFRFRYTPEQAGKYYVKFTANVKGENSITTGLLEFNVQESSLPARVKKMEFWENDQMNYVMSKDGSYYYPATLNLAGPVCPYDIAPEYNANGEVVYTPSGDDPYGCLELEAPGDAADYVYPKKRPVLSYMVFLDEVKKFKDAGGDMFRLLHTIPSYNMEFEKLNNYYDNLYMGYEMDELLNYCEENDIQMDLNMSWEMALKNVEQNYWRPGYSWEDNNYCYKTELNLTDRSEFYTNVESLKYIKYYYRYFFARYGYSKSFVMFELINEVDNNYLDSHDDGSIYYSNQPLKDVYDVFHLKMFQYLKEDLKVKQLAGISTLFAQGNMAYMPQLGNSNLVDVVSCNNYSNYLYKNEDHVKKRNIDDEFIRDHYNAIHFVGEFDVYVDTEKPDGVQNKFSYCDNNITFIKKAWSALMTGNNQFGGNWWYSHAYSVWPYFKIYQQHFSFLDLHNYLDVYYLDDNTNFDVIYRTKGGKDESIGVLINKTWNPVSSGDGTPVCNNYNNIHNQEDLIQFKNFFENDLIGNIEGFKGNTKYFVDWYNGFSGQYIGTFDPTSTYGGKLKLKHPHISVNTSLMFFKIRMASLESPMISEEIMLNDELELNQQVYSGVENNFDIMVDATDQRIQVYPNPNNGSFNISAQTSISKVEVYNLNGVLLKSYNTTKEKNFVEIKGLTSGIHLVKITLENATLFKKVTVI